MQSVYFSEDHHQFRESVRQFFAAEADPEAWERAGRIPREIWRKMGELGYLGVNFPERHGGSDADFFYSVVFLEELGRVGLGGFSAAVAVQQYMATTHIYRFGGEDLKKRYLEPSIRGELVGALAISEPDAGSDVAAIRTRAVRDGDSYVVNGAKVFITNGVDGDFVTAAVKTGADDSGGVSLLVIDRDTPGFSATPMRKMGWRCSDTGELTFENVRVPVANLIGEPNRGFHYIMQGFQLERLAAALTSLGGSDLSMALALDYIGQRRAFGRPIGKFQTIRHRLADLAAELEAARQLVYHACWRYSQGLDATRECAMAKLAATELGKTVADACLQCFGGYGYMEEYAIARLYRDARVATIVGGTSEIMREIIAKIDIDGVRYGAGDAGEPAAASADEGPALVDIFRSLPDRYRGDADLAMLVHFNFEQDGGGAYTVSIHDGACKVAEGLTGEADCAVTAAGSVYRDIELGRTSPETAYMTGKLQVSNIPLVMRFIKSFKKLDAT